MASAIHDVIQQAYSNQDGQLSILAHQQRQPMIANEPAHVRRTNRISRALLFGGQYGVLSALSVIAICYGADLPKEVSFLIGIALALTGALGLGLGEYLSSTSQAHFADMQRQRELWEMENFAEGEKQEMVEIYVSRGFSHQDATTVINILSTNKEFFVDHMMIYELDIMPSDGNDHPAKLGLVTSTSFGVAAVLPFISYAGGLHDSVAMSFGIGCAVAALVMVGLGLVKGVRTRAVARSVFVAAAHSVMVGGSAYLFGWAISLAFSGKIVYLPHE